MSSTSTKLSQQIKSITETIGDDLLIFFNKEERQWEVEASVTMRNPEKLCPRSYTHGNLSVLVTIGAIRFSANDKFSLERAVNDINKGVRDVFSGRQPKFFDDER